MMLFKSLVIPHLEYCVIVWNPYLQKEISMLEQIQRSFTSKLEGMNDLNYYQRLKKLNIYSLERRRDRYIILYIFKILLNIVPNPGLSYKFSARRGKVLTSPAVNASNTHAATLIHHSFIRRAPRIFNSLPKDLRDTSGSMITIKKNLDKFLHHIPDEPKIPGCFPTNSALSNRLEDQLLVLECSSRNHQWRCQKQSSSKTPVSKTPKLWPNLTEKFQKVLKWPNIWPPVFFSYRSINWQSRDLWDIKPRKVIAT